MKVKQREVKSTKTFEYNDITNELINLNMNLFDLWGECRQMYLEDIWKLSDILFGNRASLGYALCFRFKTKVVKIKKHMSDGGCRSVFVLRLDDEIYQVDPKYIEDNEIVFQSLSSDKIRKFVLEAKSIGSDSYYDITKEVKE